MREPISTPFPTKRDKQVVAEAGQAALGTAAPESERSLAG